MDLLLFLTAAFTVGTHSAMKGCIGTGANVVNLGWKFGVDIKRFQGEQSDWTLEVHLAEPRATSRV
jgi:hypothetical protein